MRKDGGDMGLRANLYLLAAVVICLARCQNKTKKRAKREGKIGLSPTIWPALVI